MTAPSQQKLKVDGPVVVTANRLSDGAVVYRGKLGGLDDAARCRRSRDQCRRTPGNCWRRRQPKTSKRSVPMWRRSKSKAAHIEPGNLRERIRVAGPTFDLPATFGI